MKCQGPVRCETTEGSIIYRLSDTATQAKWGCVAGRRRGGKVGKVPLLLCCHRKSIINVDSVELEFIFTVQQLVLFRA